MFNFDDIKGKLVVSCQALPDEPLHSAFIKMCRKTPSLQGWGYKARPPNLRKQLKADNFFLLNHCINY